MDRRYRSGFTLVELLVVIAIIAMLTGLLVPAVQYAREAGRRTTCVNNQKELAGAIANYESAKRRLPGYVNNVGGPRIISWVAALFPFMDRNDLWEAGWRTGAVGSLAIGMPATRVGVVVCPNDANPLNASLTYAVNLGVYGGGGGTDGTGTQPSPPFSGVNAASRPPTVADVLAPVLQPNGVSPGGLGVFRDYGAAGATNVLLMSDIRSPSRTVMLSEKVFVLPATGARQWAETWDVTTWNATMSAASAARLGFSWPNSPPLPYPPYEQPMNEDSGNGSPPDPTAPLRNTLIAVPYIRGANTYWPPLSSIHPGVAVVTFCDGHVEAVVNNTPCNVYSAVP